jgi:hypothetical protein
MIRSAAWQVVTADLSAETSIVEQHKQHDLASVIATEKGDRRLYPQPPVELQY